MHLRSIATAFQVYLCGESYEQADMLVDEFDKYTGGFEGSFADTNVSQRPVHRRLQRKEPAQY